MMDLKTTQYYLDCYGTDTTRWPEPEAGKIALAVYAKELGENLLSAKRLDAALSKPSAAPSDLLSRRIIANLPAQDGTPANDVTPSRKISWRAVAATFVMVGAIGFATLSLQSPETTAPTEQTLTAENTTEETEIWREAALDMGVDDVFDWVYSEDI